MKRSTLLAAAALALAACVDNRTSIEILGRATPSDQKTCTYTPGGQYITGNDTYDVALGGAYALALYVQNNLLDPHAVNASALTESNTWSVQAVRVRVNPSDYVGNFKPSPALASITGEAVLPMATSPVVRPAGGQGTIYVSDLLTAGFVTAIQGAAAGGQIVLGVTLQGHTNDGARLDSGEFFYALTIESGMKAACAALVCPTGTTATCNCDGQVLAGKCQ